MNRLGHFGIYRQRCASAAEGVYFVARIPNRSPMRWRKLLVDGGDAGFAVQFDEVVALGHHFEFALDHRLIANEGPVEVVRKRHVAPGFPVADGLRFFEFARKRRFRAHVQPERQMRPQRHGV